jgi:hypothetical protein
MAAFLFAPEPTPVAGVILMSYDLLGGSYQVMWGSHRSGPVDYVRILAIEDGWIMCEELDMFGKSQNQIVWLSPGGCLALKVVRFENP